jgi:hypothetical protein
MTINGIRKKSAARFAMIIGGPAKCILINVVAASLYTHNSRLMSNYRSAGTIRAQLAAATHLVARSSSGPTVVCKKNLSSTELPPTPELGAHGLLLQSSKKWLSSLCKSYHLSGWKLPQSFLCTVKPHTGKHCNIRGPRWEPQSSPTFGESSPPLPPQARPFPIRLRPALH